MSPADRPGELLAKIAQWLEAGTKLVWVIDPRSAEVYRLDSGLTIIGTDSVLDGEDVFPGFACALKDVLS